MIDEYYTFKMFGYHSYDLKPRSHKLVVAVCDGCNIYREQPMYYNHDMCISCSQKNENLPDKTPLTDGFKSKLSNIKASKESATYLGSIAETILANIYKDVQVMPYRNSGYDIICNRDFKIDIKSSAAGDKGYWQFTIRQNQIADYFLCIAFNNRDDLHNPAHLWMIPGHVINHLGSLWINKSKLDKWDQYELSLDKLTTCCNNRHIQL